METAERARENYKSALIVIGGLFSAPGIISVLNSQIALGLSPFFANMITYYESGLRAFADAIRFSDWPVIVNLNAEARSHLLGVAPFSMLCASLYTRSALGLLDWHARLVAIGSGVLYSALLIGGAMIAYSKALVVIWLSAVLLCVPLLVLLTPGKSVRKFAWDIILGTAATAVAVVVFYLGNIASRAH